MFWKDVKGLAILPVGTKLAITVLLALLGIGYLFGFLNIYYSYSPVDENPGLSLDDIRISFYGAREMTKLEKSIDGTMKEKFFSEGDLNKTRQWIADGAKEEEWNSTIQPIFDASCSTCHSKQLKVADVVTEEYADVEEYLVQDTGKSVSRLVSLSHTHISATLSVLFILVFIFSFTLYPSTWKSVIMIVSFLSIAMDIGAWWLAKLSPSFAILVILGGITLAMSYLVLISLSLYDMWFKKVKQS